MEKCESWANNFTWLGADESIYAVVHDSESQQDETGVHLSHRFWLRNPDSRETWTPPNSQPLWLTRNPPVFLKALKLLEQSRGLHELEWREFEELIGELLELEGWTVDLTRASDDGGIDVIACKQDATIGLIKSVWQAKKYSPSNTVKLHHVRELSAVREDEQATKGVIATTSRLTSRAIEYISRDQYRLDWLASSEIQDWIRKLV